MAIKAKAQITLSAVVDVDYVYKYYKLQSSTASAPSVPTSYPPTGWTETEPSYTSGSTNTLYTVECNVFSDGTWSYTNVCKSSAYEAAKAAYNKATNAEKVATNYLNFSNNGLVVGNMTASSLGKNVLIDTDSVDIRNGTDTLASFQGNKVILGINDADSEIDLCDGAGTIKAITSGASTSYPKYDSIEIDSQEISHNSQRFNANTTNVSGTDTPTYENTSELYQLSMKSSDGAYARLKAECKTTASGDKYQVGVSAMANDDHSNSRLLLFNAFWDESENTWSDSNQVNVYPDKTTMSKPIYFTKNNMKMFSKKPDGVTVETLNLCNASGNIVLGYGNYEAGDGNTNVYGNDVYLGPKLGGGTYRPYYRPGDSVSIDIYTAGFVTNAGKEVWFTVPLCKPIIGVSTVTPSSVNGFMLRENNAYTHGSSASVYAKPSSYVGYLHATNEGVKIKATFSTTTNVVNNSPIGIRWSGEITFA